MKTHWLYGRGPNKVLDFTREIEEETDCMKCHHREVCDHDKERRCENFEFGSSEGHGCQGCIHKYTRYDEKAVPCFTCPWFEARVPQPDPLTPPIDPDELIVLAKKVAAETGVTDSNGLLARLFASWVVENEKKTSQ